MLRAQEPPVLRGALPRLPARRSAPCLRVNAASAGPGSRTRLPAQSCTGVVAGSLVAACGRKRQRQSLVERRQADREEESLTSEMQSRLAQIQAAIRRGEERAERETDGEEPPRQMTPEEEQLLEKLFVRPEDLTEAYEAAPSNAPAPTEEKDAAEDPHTVRIRKTVEFCPDGALAWEILQEIVASGERPRVEAYDIVIEAFSRHGATDDALAVFKAVKEAGLEPTDQSYDFLATPASKSGEYRFVEMLFAAKASTKPDGQIGARALKLLLDAYANGLPRQAGKAQSAFRGAMAAAESAEQKPSDAAPGEVLKALRRAVGPNVFRELQEEYGLEPDEIV